MFKYTLLLIFFFSTSSFAFSEQEVRAAQELFGMKMDNPSACVPNGYSCNSSFDCCSNWCRDGECYEIGGGCKGNGATCNASFDCCSNWCRDGKCYEIGGCIPQGGDCERSFDCCSGLSCWRDKCQ